MGNLTAKQKAILAGQKQPAPFQQFQVVAESRTLKAAIYALDVDGKLWMKVIEPLDVWVLEEEAATPRRGDE